MWVSDGVRYYGEIYFKEQEMIDLFAGVYKRFPEVAYVLHLTPDFSTGKLTASIHTNTDEFLISTLGKVGKSSYQKFL